MYFLIGMCTARIPVGYLPDELKLGGIDAIRLIISDYTAPNTDDRHENLLSKNLFLLDSYNLTNSTDEEMAMDCQAIYRLHLLVGKDEDEAYAVRMRNQEAYWNWAWDQTVSKKKRRRLSETLKNGLPYLCVWVSLTLTLNCLSGS